MDSSKDQLVKSPEDAKLKSLMSFGSWDLLPLHIWENILSWLPISSLMRMKLVCKAWKSIIQCESFLTVLRKVNHNPEDVYFVLFADFNHINVAAAYSPLEHKWFMISLSHISSSCPSTCCKLRRTLVSGGGLVLAEDRKGSIVVSNLFTRTFRTLPSMLPSIWPYAISLIELDSSYKIVAVSVADKVYSQVYDSVTNAWEAKGEFDVRFAVLGNAVYWDGFLYCLSHAPDYLLAFDLDYGTWSVIDVVMPSIACSHMLVHDGKLILVGGVEECGEMRKICIWEYDQAERQWHGICVMPDHLFYMFKVSNNGNLNHFFTVDGGGKICFCKSTSSLVLMCDLAKQTWWWLPPCPLGSSISRHSWFGHALEPRMDVLI